MEDTHKSSWPAAKRPEPTPERDRLVAERCDRVQKCWEQYVDGAITYIEFVRFAWSQVTEEDVEEINSYREPDDPMRAEWPFQG